MSQANRTTTKETNKIAHDLSKSKSFRDAKVDVYRYNSASIRIRIVDDCFKGKSLVEREEMVLPLIRKLPKKTQSDITVLLLLAPEEVSGSLMNLEFEDPTPSRL